MPRDFLVNAFIFSCLRPRVTDLLELSTFFLPLWLLWVKSSPFWFTYIWREKDWQPWMKATWMKKRMLLILTAWCMTKDCPICHQLIMTYFLQVKCNCFKYIRNVCWTQWAHIYCFLLKLNCALFRRFHCINQESLNILQTSVLTTNRTFDSSND